MIYMFLADGFEETEALATLDIMRRANIDVKTIGIGKNEITGAHGIKVFADMPEQSVCFEGDFSGVVLPGGGDGTKNLKSSLTVKVALQKAMQKNLPVCAICAAPTVLAKYGYLDNKKATCYPGCEDELFGAQYVNEPVVTDGNIITAWGMGASIKFGLKIVEYICSKEQADKVEDAIKCAW